MCGNQEEGPKGTTVVEGTSESNDKEQGRLERSLRGIEQVRSSLHREEGEDTEKSEVREPGNC